MAAEVRVRGSDKVDSAEGAAGAELVRGPATREGVAAAVEVGLAEADVDRGPAAGDSAVWEVRSPGVRAATAPARSAGTQNPTSGVCPALRQNAPSAESR